MSARGRLHSLSTLHDNSEYAFLTLPGADVQLRFLSSPGTKPELQIFGNRAGLFSIANLFLWLHANASRRELLTLGVLPFVHGESSLSVLIRMTAEESTGTNGIIRLKDRSQQLEWCIAEEDVQELALLIHRLASVPEHEYDRLHMHPDTEADVYIRMSDAEA